MDDSSNSVVRVGDQHDFILIGVYPVRYDDVGGVFMWVGECAVEFVLFEEL